jgi:hypothetical protein
MVLPSASHFLVDSSTGIQSPPIPSAEVFIVETAPVQLTYEIELQEGEKLTLPDSLIASVGAGRWLISLQPAPFRDHRAFLSSYAPEDEGLYDAYPPR